MPGQGWYNQAAVRGYPFDDAATMVDDAGSSPPEGFLVDARILVPKTVGRCVFLSGLTITDRLVTMLFSASTRYVRVPQGYTEPALVYTPVACVNVLKSELDIHRQLPLRIFAAGTIGWVVLGPGIEQNYTGRFSTHEQASLLLRCGRHFNDRAVQTMSALALAPLTGERDPNTGLNFMTFGTYIDQQPAITSGIVKFRAEGDLEIVVQERFAPYVAGIPSFEAAAAVDRPVFPVVVFRLKDRKDQNVLKLYAGPCSGRPDSDSCARPAVETLGGLRPSCEGDLTIVFEGMDALILPEGVGGIGVKLDATLDGTCGVDNDMPDDDGIIPGAIVDGCESDSSSSGSSDNAVLEMPLKPKLKVMSKPGVFQPPPDAADDPNYSIEIIEPEEALPYDAVFDPGGLPAGWAAWAGQFNVAAGDHRNSADVHDQGWSLAASANQRLNLAVWQPEEGAIWPLKWRLATALNFGPGRRNAGLALTGDRSTRNIRFLAARVNEDSLELGYYARSKFAAAYVVAERIGLSANQWYFLTATLTRVANGYVDVSVELTGITDPGFPPARITAAKTVPIDEWSRSLGVFAVDSVVNFSATSARQA